jgi:hypothetical protein
MTCEQFLAVREELQPRVAYWLDGYAAGGGTGAKGDSAQAGAKAAVAPVSFSRDMAVVVAECQGSPKESVWEKIRKEFRRP